MLVLRLAWTLLAGMLALGAGVAPGQTTSTGSGQAYPNKPIRIVAGGAGGGGDVTARVIAQGISEGVGQPVIVDGRGGGADIVAQIVGRAPPDGYTLLLATGSFMLLPFMRDKAPYDPVKDFTPVSLVLRSPNVLVVNPSIGVKSVKELIALAKAKPGQLNYGIGTVGGQVHLSLELFKSMAGINIVQINYKGSSLAQNALLAGEVQISGGVSFSVLPHIKAGRMISLGVTSAQPSPLAPGMSTIASQGLPGYEVVSTFGIFAPAGTPSVVINRLYEAIARFCKRPDVAEKFLNTGAEAVGSSPQEYAATVKAEMARMGKVIRDAGIRDE